MARDTTLIWRDLLNRLLADPNLRASMRGYFQLLKPKGVMGGTIYLEVEQQFTRDMVEQRGRQALLEAIATLPADDEVTSFAVTVNPNIEPLPAPLEPEVESVSPSDGPIADLDALNGDVDLPQTSTSYPQVIERAESPNDDAPRISPAVHRHADHSVAEHEDSRLNPKYTFDNFIIGGSNSFAHAAAVAVAEAPARNYNPLFIYGESGLGKTHLLHSIGNYAESIYPGIQVRYVSSEEFTNDFINSIANNKRQEFNARYRSNDILLIDDIQFLTGKDSTMEAFFHTFNTLHEHSKQVVITSDVAPKQLTGFEERMVSRFSWGLITDVQSPDLETRIAILRKKAQADNISLPDDAIEFIAAHVTSSIRELEGMLLRVTAHANFSKAPIDLALVTTVLKDLISNQEPTVIMPQEIILTTADYFRMPVEDLYGSSRSHAIATVRQIAMYLCREMTSLSLPKIGQLFGGRDHTTVMYAHRKIAKRMTEDRETYNQVTELTARLRQGRSS